MGHWICRLSRGHLKSQVQFCWEITMLSMNAELLEDQYHFHPFALGAESGRTGKIQIKGLCPGLPGSLLTCSCSLASLLTSPFHIESVLIWIRNMVILVKSKFGVSYHLSVFLISQLCNVQPELWLSSGSSSY